MSEGYDDYLREHIGNVKRAYLWLKRMMPDIFEDIGTIMLDEQIGMHDRSKSSGAEYGAYDDYFYGGRKDMGIDPKFDRAWLHHIHRNPHHWQHWVLLDDSGELRALDMPVEFAIEMICDWWSFGWANGELGEILKWYYDEGNGSKMVLSDSTREFVESILFRIAGILERFG